MGYGQSLIAAARSETLGITTGIGKTLTSGTAGVYGSLVTIGTTNFSYDGFFINVGKNTTGRHLLRVYGNNGVLDLLIADGVFVDGSAGSANGGGSILVPVRIPSGYFVKASHAANSNAQTVFVSIVGFQGDPRIVGGFSKLVSLTDFGAASVDPANLITLSGNTLTGFSQIVSSTSANVAALYAGFDSNAQTLGTGGISFDVAWGGAGAEQTLLTFDTHTNGAAPMELPLGPIPCAIPAGTRLSARAQCSLNTETHIVGVVLSGLVA